MAKRERSESSEVDESVLGVEESAPPTDEDGASPPPPEPEPEPDPEPAPPRRARPGFLLVAANPFCAVDPTGRPSGACPLDPHDPRFYDPSKTRATVRGFVGAVRVVGDVTRPAPRNAELYQRTERRDVAWEFEREPFELPDTGFYRRQLADGVLLDGTTDYEGARLLAKARSNCAAEPRWITR